MCVVSLSATSPFSFGHHFASITTNFDPSTLPRYLSPTTLSLFHHTFFLLLRFLTLTTLSSSYQTFFLLSFVTLSSSCHHLHLTPRFSFQVVPHGQLRYNKSTSCPREPRRPRRDHHHNLLAPRKVTSVQIPVHTPVRNPELLTTTSFDLLQ